MKCSTKQNSANSLLKTNEARVDANGLHPKRLHPKRLHPKRLSFFIADGFQALDLFGPLDTFEEANSIVSESYRCEIVSFEEGSVKSSSRHRVYADRSIFEVDATDYLIVCGGTGIRQLKLSVEQLLALKKLADSAERVISICTGAFVLAQIYGSEELTLTTHWRYCHELASIYKNSKVLNDPLFINDQHIWSSAGILSGVDLSLEMVRQDLGNTVAAAVAKELVVYLQRKGTQKQFSDLLKTQSSNSLRLAPLLEWLTLNLKREISVSDMAGRMSMSERQLTRLFKSHLNATPAQYLSQLRMNQARDLLSQDNRSLQDVSRQVGYSSYESFRRSFERYFGLSPSSFRA